MFGELPKIFDKNFALSYFFPPLVFIALATFTIRVAGISGYTLPYLNGELVNDLSVVVLFSYIAGILLLIGNREIYRFLEGYGKYNPLKLFSGFETKRYKRIIREVKELDNKYYSPNFTARDRKRRTELMQQLSSEFPDKEELILPTSLGNVIRAFEIYPRVMYGIEYIDSWSRLQAVMPPDFRELVDSAKARTDLWVNFQYLATLLFFLVGCLLVIKPSSILLSFLLLLFGFNISCMQRAKALAIEWGDYAKSSFDIFVPKLREALGFPEAKNRNIEKQQWTRFSQAIIFRLPEIMPEVKSPPNQPRKTRTKTKAKKKIPSSSKP